MAISLLTREDTAATRRAVSEFKEFRDKGEEFNYIGIKMIVVSHYRIGYPTYIIPLLKARYINKLGELEIAYFTPSELPVLKDQNKRRTKMKTRKEVAEYINSGQCYDDCVQEKRPVWHFGKLEVRKIMDFIYGDEPEKDECIHAIRGRPPLSKEAQYLKKMHNRRKENATR